MSQTNRRFPIAHAFSQLLRLILPVAALLTSSRVAISQTSTITEGARVQITAAGAKRVTGVVKSVSADSTTLFVEENGGVRRLALKDITDLRISTGRSSLEGAKRGAMWGGAIGTGLAVAVFAAFESDHTIKNRNSLFPGFVQAALGAATWGAGIGAFVRAERWDSIPLHATLSTSSRSVGLSFAFSPSLLH